MIEELQITNLGIIASACIPFGPGLNVLTGETGAGKTMVLNSVQLLTGARGSAQFVKSGAIRCEVVSTFGVDTDWVTEFRSDLTDKGAILDERESSPDGLIISRELTNQGEVKRFLGASTYPLEQSLTSPSLSLQYMAKPNKYVCAIRRNSWYCLTERAAMNVLAKFINFRWLAGIGVHLSRREIH